MVPIASARMYSWSPSLTAAWRRLLEWVTARAGAPLDVLELADPYPLEKLWARDDLGCVFMCGYPWVMIERERPHLLAAPVPSPPRYGGRPIYFTDFVVRADSPYQTLEDTFGGCLAYSAEHSHSGYNAARFHLLDYRRPDRPTLYGRVLGPLHRQLPVIDAVLDGRADVGPVDAYGLDLLRRHGAERAGRVRVVASTVAAPSAPLVASPAVDEDTRERVTQALLAAHTAPEMAATLDELLLARFVRVRPDDFGVFLERQRAAEDAGYAKVA
jgi:ABC-type phosphate/phosphonate transport system substrate-binding protein